ncbi:hypothetical protein UY3_17133 [Chelonia mydas]|uniref:Uncharacterized protein n=1 Tax=Chelonia mydas TaxID=8469 RepID=M7BCA0_CHEMY|nr:hypothetical protein UY3_17133 [Chelonia mydas]
MRRNAWLQSSGLPPEVQQTLQDLPFDGQGLFAQQTNSRLHSLKDSWNTIKSLGMHAPATQRKPFKPQATQQRSFPPRPRQDFSRRKSRYNDASHHVLHLSRAKSNPNPLRALSTPFEGAHLQAIK